MLELQSGKYHFSVIKRIADVIPHSNDGDENPPYFGQGKTKFPQELIQGKAMHLIPFSMAICRAVV